MAKLSVDGNDKHLEQLLSVPHPELVAMMKRLNGDIIILGVAGKMGVTMAMQAQEAVRIAGVDKKIYGVARFSNPEEKRKLDACGINTISCDLMDEHAVMALPDVPNVIFMAGRKFGTQGSEALTWAMNTLLPVNVCKKYANCNIVAFSTGCVYPLAADNCSGNVESDLPMPVGEYSQSCLARERIFEYCTGKYGIKLLLFRLNYAIDLRYGVLHDIALPIFKGEAVDISVGRFNAIWQGDANACALRALELCSDKVEILNVTGPETVSTEDTAMTFGKLFNKEVRFKGTPSGLAYLSDASKMCRLLGKPRYTMDELIEAQAQWLIAGGSSIGKPTHFEVSNGKF